MSFSIFSEVSLGIVTLVASRGSSDSVVSTAFSSALFSMINSTSIFIIYQYLPQPWPQLCLYHFGIATIIICMYLPSAVYFSFQREIPEEKGREEEEDEEGGGKESSHPLLLFIMMDTSSLLPLSTPSLPLFFTHSLTH